MNPNVLYTYFTKLTKVLAYAHTRGQDYHHAAALLVMECEGIFETYTAPKKFGTKRWFPIDNTSIMAELISVAYNRGLPDDDWGYRLDQFIRICADFSLQQRYDALIFVLNGKVERTSETTFVVHSSKPYAVSLPNGDDLLAGGFTCLCKGFWSHGGGDVCKHVAASLMMLLEPIPETEVAYADVIT